MNKKIIGIFVCMLMVSSMSSAVSLQVEHNESLSYRLIQKEDIDSFLLSSCLSNSFFGFEPTDLSKKIYTNNCLFSQLADGDILEMIQQLDETMYLRYLENITAFGPRVTGTDECKAAGTYIYNEFQSMGLYTRYQNYSYEGYSDRNIEATLNGTNAINKEIFIISAHHDTNINSPGADDGGSGVAAMLCVANILRQYSFNHTIRFVSFSGKYQDFCGSHKYAEEIYEKGDNIIGVINADNMGYAKTEIDIEFNNIFISENTASQELTTFLRGVSQQYTEYINLGVQRNGAWSDWSDHFSFWEFGYNAIWFAQISWAVHSGTPSDTIENMNIPYALKGSKLLLASLAELADSNIGSLPKKPVISGLEEGEIDEELTFSASTIDPYNKQISYKWDWGDGNRSEWYGPYESGILISTSHSWNEKGIYPIKVKVKNTDGLESYWSNPYVVGIPKKNEDTDQQNTYGGLMGYAIYAGGQFAQSFTPSKNTITKVSLNIFKSGNPPGITISIRDDLNNGDLTSAYLQGNDIQGEKKAGWYDFIFPEIEVIPGNKYYIVWSPDNNDPRNIIYWAYGDNNPYINGEPWENNGYAWEVLNIPSTKNADFCFKTYFAKTKINKNINFPMINKLIQYKVNKFSPLLTCYQQRMIDTQQGIMAIINHHINIIILHQ